MIRALALCLMATPAMAGPVMEIGTRSGIRGPSTVTIAPTDRPGALAQITFNNVSVNNEADTGTTGTIDLGGLAVDIQFEWEVDVAGSDMVTITPPEGVVCFPRCTIQIVEDSSAVIWLFSYEGVGS